jgi:ubiquinone/menaquinone biosynthesis C-methylase UbiE
MSPGEIRFIARCIDKLGYPFQGDESLLDVGCGNGRVSRALRERVGSVHAVDVVDSPEWQDAPGLSFRLADGERLPFEDAAFDVVHSKDSLHHMARPERALTEYRRVLRPGGTALIVEANRYNPSLYLQMTLVRRHRHFAQSRFRKLVRAAFPGARFGAFEAHYVPCATRLLGLQERIEDALERLTLLRPTLSYNFAVCGSTGGRWGVTTSAMSAPSPSSSVFSHRKSASDDSGR